MTLPDPRQWVDVNGIPPWGDSRTRLDSLLYRLDHSREQIGKRQKIIWAGESLGQEHLVEVLFPLAQHVEAHLRGVPPWDVTSVHTPKSGTPPCKGG